MIANSVDTAEEIDASNQILTQIMSNHHNITYPFMNPINGTILDMPKYDELIRFPVWLRQIADNLHRGKYPGIREFVSDFRLMLANCFRFNGIHSKVGRLAERLETLFEQKLQLLPVHLRAKTSMRACLGLEDPKPDTDNGQIRRRASTRHYSSGLDSQICPVRALMEEVEHAGDVSDLSVPLSSSTAISTVAILYEYSPDTPITTANSFALLVARLTDWRRKQHEAELIASWKDWWTANTQARATLETLRKCPQFLEVYQHLWLLDPFIGISDAMSAGTTLYHNIPAFNGDISLDNVLLPFNSTTTSSRQLCLAELELALCAAPQASICLSASVSALINTPKEREKVSEAIAALKKESEVKKPADSVNGNAGVRTAMELDLDGDADDVIPESGTGSSAEKVRLSSNRRILNSHVDTLKKLAAPPYEVWERRLASRLDHIYEDLSLDRRLEDPVRSERRYGISLAFFEVCGREENPLKEKRFHQLTLLQQINILLGLTSSLLLSNGSLCYSENLRYSIDKSTDWDVCAPIILGIDPFRGSTYMHFPQMLHSEFPRVFHYRCPQPDYDSIAPTPSGFLPAVPVMEETDESYILPTLITRLPSWMEQDLVLGVRSHIMALVGAEIENLSNRIASGDKNSKNTKKDRVKLNRLSQILDAFKSINSTSSKNGGKPSSSKSKLKSKRKMSFLPPPKLNRSVQDIQLADFIYVDRMPCGVVPISATYARPSNYVPKSSLRTVESTTSLAESNSNTAATNNTSEAPTPNPLTFFQDDDGDSNPAGVDSEANSQPETLEERPGPSPDSPATEALSSAEDGLHIMDEEAKLAEEEAVKRAEMLMSQQAEIGCKTANDAQSDNQKSNIGTSLVKSETDRMKLIYEMIIKATEAEVDRDNSLFETVVSDFDTLKQFSQEIASRLVTARRLLEELSTACKALEEDPSSKANSDATHSSPLRRVIDQFSSQLGDAVWINVKSDPQLLHFLEGSEGHPVKKEEAEPNTKIAEAEAPKNPRKRRNTAPLPYQSRRRPRRSTFALPEEPIVEEKLPPYSRLLELHEQAVDSLSALVDALKSLEEDAKSNEDERLATEQTAGMLLRKDIESRLPPPPRPPVEKKRQIVSVTFLSPQLQTTAQMGQVRSPAPTTLTPIVRPNSIAPSPARILIPPNQGTFFIQRPFPLASGPSGPRPRPLQRPPFRPRLPPQLFRFYGNLFTEEGLPVRLAADRRTLIHLPPDSIPPEQRREVMAQIQRYQSAAASKNTTAAEPRPSTNSVNSQNH